MSKILSTYQEIRTLINMGSVGVVYVRELPSFR